jgi:hypothetical protein
MVRNEFDDFCRFAFTFLETRGTRYLVIGGLAGVARRHGARLDIGYLHTTLRPICELAEDMGPWNRLERVLATGPSARG